MSLLTMIQRAADELGLTRPSVVVASTATDVRQLLALAQSEGEELAKRHDWKVLQKEATITLVTSTAAYAKEADFDRFIDSTHWDRTNRWSLLGPISPQEWQLRKSGLVTTAPRLRFRYKGSTSTQIFIDPTPTSSENNDILAYEYVSNQWCKSSGGTGQTAWAADGDTGILPEALMRRGIKWRFLKAKGFTYDEEFREYENAVDREAGQEGGSKTLSLTRVNQPLVLLNSGQIPETGFGS